MNFVTGGTGLVGSHLIYDLIQKGEKVRALKRSTSNTTFVEKIFSYYSPEAITLFEKIDWVEGDVLDFYSIKDALEGITSVYHCAAIVAFSNKQKEKIIQENVQGTANLVNACLDKKVRKFCHVSSIAALGKSETGGPVTEEAQWTNSKYKSAYSISKHLSEREVWRGIAEGLNAVIVNPSIILGPGNWESGSAKFFSTIYKGLKFYTKGVTGYVDVRDVSKAMILLMDQKISGERFILNSENTSYEFVLKSIAKNLGVKPPSVYANKSMGEIAWRWERIKEIISGTPALITRDTARTSHKKNYFSSQKLINELGLEFIPVEQSVRSVAILFLKEFKSSLP